ncbi:MAG: phospholipid-binding lipoprotein MlaA [Chitinophagales bacterium]|jgi:phospholipid-binding lipoprotein MlaA
MITTKVLPKLASVLVFWCLSSVAAAQDFQSDVNSADPWEPFNRSIHAFNMQVDKFILLPAAKSYQFFTPQVIDNGITNMFNNVRIIPTFVNDVLQVEIVDAGWDVLRFSANITFGLFGFFDAATKMGIPYEREDFGLTFAKWGMPAGPYLTIPLWGPSTVRDAIGLLPEQALSPTFNITHKSTRNTITAVYFVDSRADVIALSGLVTGDSYNFFRDAYLQNRKAIINGGFVDDFGEQEFDGGFDDF